MTAVVRTGDIAQLSSTEHETESYTDNTVHTITTQTQAQGNQPTIRIQIQQITAKRRLQGTTQNSPPIEHGLQSSDKQEAMVNANNMLGHCMREGMYLYVHQLVTLGVT
jgi:hypothetical protein